MKKPLEILEVTQSFGARPEYYKKFGLLGHEGTDYRTKSQKFNNSFWNNLIGWQKVYAVTDGVCVCTYSKGGYGTHIWLTDDSGNQYLYAHLKNARPPRESRTTNGSLFFSVKEGDVIGITNRSGNSQGAHLHFSYRPHNANPNNGFGGMVDPSGLFNSSIMEYTIINSDPNLLEQARQLLVQYSVGKLDCKFNYWQLPPIYSPGLFPTEEQILFLKNYPVQTPFCFLTYKSEADPGMNNMVTKSTPGLNTIVTASKGTPTPFNICYEMVHAETFRLLDLGFPVGIPADVNTPDENFLKQKLATILPYVGK